MSTLPISPSGICGLPMAVFLDPSEHVVDVVPHVPTEFQERRTRMGQTPVFQRALGQPEHLGEFVLGEERRSCLCRQVHTQKVHERRREQPAFVGTGPYLPGHQNASTTPHGYLVSYLVIGPVLGLEGRMDDG